MAFDPNQPGVPVPNINPQPPTSPTPTGIEEQQIRTMRADLGAPAPTGLPSFDTEEPAFTPETTVPTPQIPSVDQIVAQGGGKSHLWMILGGVGFVVLALVGYFVVAPMFSSETPAPVETPVTVTPTPTPASPAPVQPAVIHKTEFINMPTATVSQIIAVAADGSINPVQLKGAMVTQGQAGKMGLTEIVFTDSTGAPIPLGKILTALGGDVQAAITLNTAFTNDGTVFIYKDATGVWPGYIGEMASAEPANLATLTGWIESSKTLANFFIVNPGTIAPFKNGIVNNLNDRYAPGTTAGASFGYLITKNKLLISTSFAGMKEALRLMGL